MGRPEKPVDPDAGPVQRLAWHLRQLRERAGGPSYRRLARTAHFSASTLAEAAKGDRLASLEVTLAYAEALGGDVDEWRARWTATANEVAQLYPVPDDVDERCPYQGLSTFQPEQAEWFFGRTHEVERLAAMIGRRPFAGVLGASGSGKSSLLRAGLIGSLTADKAAAQRWRIMLMTPSEHPLETLSEQVAKLSGTDVEALREAYADDPAALDIAVRAALARGPADTRALLVVDQFEEVFTLCDDEDERRTFVDALLDLSIGTDRRTTVVVGVRADFLAHVSQYPRLLAALDGDATMLVGPVAPDELREIITRPAAQVGMGIEPDLLTTILADTAAEPGALPLVSHALLETWQHRRGPTLTLAAYQATGGVRGAIAQTAERVHADLDPARRRTLRQIVLRLTALGEGTEDTRRPIQRSELDGLADTGTVDGVLAELARARLVVLGDGTVDVAHEALIRAWPRLHRWLSDDRANLVLHRRLTDAAYTWEGLGRDEGALFRGAQLYAARAWSDEHPGEANRLETAFLSASTALAESEADRSRRLTRLLKRLVAGVTVLLVLAVLGGVIAFRQGQDARQQERTALADGLSLQARGLVPTDPTLAGLLAVEAERLHSDGETRGGVLSVAAVPDRHEFTVPGGVNSITFTPDHKLMASASGDGSLVLWDPVQHKKIADLPKLARGTAAAFGANGTALATAGYDQNGGGVLAVWNPSTRTKVWEVQLKDFGGFLAFSPDGRHVAASVVGGIALYDLPSLQPRTLLTAGRTPQSMSFSADGVLLASANARTKPIVWNVASGSRQAELDSEHVYSVKFSPTGRRLAGAADDKGVYFWDLAGTPTALPTLPLEGSFGWTISPVVGSTIAVADETGQVSVWDVAARKRLSTFQDRGRTETISVALSGDGAMLASGGFNGTIVLHDLTRQPFSGFTAQVKDIKVSPDGSGVATAGSDRMVRLWKADGTPMGALGPHNDELAAVAYSPDGRLLAAVTRTAVVSLWDVATQKRIGAPMLSPNLGASTDLQFNGDATMLAAATFGPNLWDLHDRAHPVDRTAKFESKVATALAFLPDGKRLIAGNVGGYLAVWSIQPADFGKFLQRVDTGQGALQDIALSPDGTLLATAGDRRTIKLWDVATLKEAAVLSGHTAPIQKLAFSADGRRLASAGDDATVMVWDVGTRQRVVTLTGHDERILGLAFTPSGRVLSGGDDGRVLDWTLDVAAAADQICSRAGRTLTADEWAAYLPSLPYKPTCGPAVQAARGSA